MAELMPKKQKKNKKTDNRKKMTGKILNTCTAKPLRKLTRSENVEASTHYY